MIYRAGENYIASLSSFETGVCTGQPYLGQSLIDWLDGRDGWLADNHTLDESDLNWGKHFSKCRVCTIDGATRHDI